MNNSSINTTCSRLIPVPDWNKYHDWPSVGGLRWLIFNKKNNGFDTVVKKVRKRVLLDEAAFFQWVNNQDHNMEAK